MARPKKNVVNTPEDVINDILPTVENKVTEYPLYTMSFNVNGQMLSIRTNSYVELKKESTRGIDLLIERSKEVHKIDKELKLSVPVPDWAQKLKPESCKKCGSTELAFTTGTDKNGKDYYAFDCLSCKTEVRGRSYQTRHFIDPPISKKKPTEVPQTENKNKDSNTILCVECLKDGKETNVPPGVLSFCKTKNMEPTCFNCQQKLKKENNNE